VTIVILNAYFSILNPRLARVCQMKISGKLRTTLGFVILRGCPKSIS
jgi:hypothetical protein